MWHPKYDTICSIEDCYGEAAIAIDVTCGEYINHLCAECVKKMHAMVVGKEDRVTEKSY